VVDASGDGAATEEGGAETLTPLASPRATRPGTISGTAATLAWAVTVVAIVVGAAMRGWYLFHRPTTSDEAIAGLMANQILHGHFSTFYWDQAYGGVEPYVIAARLAIFGNSTFLLALVPTLLSVGSGFVTWRIARRLVPDPALAALAAAAAWVGPQTIPYNATYEYGFRGVTLLLGLLLVLFSLRILDGDRRPLMFVGLGLAAGVGWWSSPEIVYFAVPAALLVLVAIFQSRTTARSGHWLRNSLIGAGAMVVGALPWLWTNVHSGFASLKSSTFNVPAGAPHYAGRLRLFFHFSIPILFSLRSGSVGTWLYQRDISIAILAVLLLVLAAALVLCFLSGWRQRAIAFGVVVFPFLVVISPATWFWEDGRYVGFVVPLFVLVFMVGCFDVARRLADRRADKPDEVRAVGRLLFGGLVVILMFLSVANFDATTTPLRGFFDGWGNPDGPTVRSISKLESDGVRDGYAGYWIAYRLDFLSAGKLQLTVAGSDPDRWVNLNQEVHDAPSTSWIFVRVTPISQSQFSGAAASGPGGLTEAQLTADLRRSDTHYRVVTSGFLQAVVPDRPLTPAEVGLP
jgi:hypothetical protein